MLLEGDRQTMKCSCYCSIAASQQSNQTVINEMMMNEMVWADAWKGIVLGSKIKDEYTISNAVSKHLTGFVLSPQNTRFTIFIQNEDKNQHFYSVSSLAHSFHILQDK